MTDDRDDDTAAEASGTDETLAAPPAPPVSGTEHTIAASIEARPDERSDLATAPRARPAESASARTVGDDLRAASVQQFGEVDRDRYEMLGELARGGLGRVFRARDPRTGRVVALKEVLRPTTELVVRFAREALVTANLQHPAIIPVYEVGRWPSGEPFYAMKLVRGRALDAVIADATTTAARIALVPHLIAVADALAYAHSEHVIHRDLKPSNVLIGPYGETVVIDWGLARDLTATDEGLATPAPASSPAAPGETVAGAVIGTPAYMPREQATGQPLDERADVYAIGAILYHVLAGARPYADAHTIAAILQQVEAGPPRALAALAPEVPAELVAIVDKAMARAPADRYPTAEGLADDLRRFQAGQLVGAHRYSAWQLLRRFVSRHRGAVLTAAAAAVALAIFGAISVRRIAAERDEVRRQRDIAQHERADAQASRALAERRFAAGLEELGRQATLAGDPERALPFLVAAAAAQPDPGAALELLLGQARAAFAGLIGLAPVHTTGLVSADLTPDGARLITTSYAEELRVWDLAAHAEAWRADAVLSAEVSPDGRWLLGTNGEGIVTIRAVDDGRVHRQWTVPPASPPDRWLTLVWAATGDRFAIGSSGGRVAVGTLAADAPALGDAHDGELYTLEFSPDGRALASSGADGGVVIRDPATGRARTRLTDGGATAVAVVWLDDARLYAGGGDGIARSWRVAERAVERRLAHGTAIYGLAIDRAADLLVTYGHGEAATVWSAATGEPRVRLSGHGLAVHTAVFVGAWLVTLDEVGTIATWDPRTGERLQLLPAEGVASTLLGRGDLLLDRGDARARVWRLAPESTVRRVPGHTARIRDLRFDRDGAVLWSASNDGSARGFELATGGVRVLGRAAHTELPIASPTDAAAQQPPFAHGLRSLTLTPDGATVVTASEDGTIGLWDAATGASRGEWRGHTGRVRRVVVSADGRVGYSVGDTTLRRWDVATGRETAKADLGDTTWDVALLAGETVVVTYTDDGRTLGLWGAATLAPAGKPAVHHNRLRELVVVGDRLIVAVEGHVAILGRDGRELAIAVHNMAFAADVAATPEGTIAVGDARGEVVLHDGKTAQPIRRWQTGDVPVVTAVRFRPDGAILATAGGNRVRLWDPATGRKLVESPEVPAMITQLVWSPDGRRLAFAGGSGTAWVWELPTGAGAEPERFTRCASPWMLHDSALAAAPFDPATCAALSP